MIIPRRLQAGTWPGCGGLATKATHGEARYRSAGRLPPPGSAHLHDLSPALQLPTARAASSRNAAVRERMSSLVEHPRLLGGI